LLLVLAQAHILVVAVAVLVVCLREKLTPS
jgi:hypothetical protein